jgi:hypothetical protein
MDPGLDLHPEPTSIPHTSLKVIGPSPTVLCDTYQENEKIFVHVGVYDVEKTDKKSTDTKT